MSFTPLSGAGITPALFLRKYWQKRPLLVRGAFPGFTDPVTPDDLAGLACEPDVESRLVMERGGKKPWQVTHGPQDPARLRRLPPSHWTLLVQGVDRWVPGAAALLDSFRFIPDWRVDDVMVSFAPRAGTVGPHVDSYDVFLLQGKGRRRWRIDERSSGECRPGLDLRILKEFRPQQEWVLGPGDMLYLPPGVAHHGVALEDCLTYSVGFRAPSAMEVLGAVLQNLAEGGGSSLRYHDPGLLSSHPGELPRAAVRRMRALAMEGFGRLGEEAFAALVGKLLTEPKISPSDMPARISPEALRRRLEKGAVFSRAPGSRLAFVRRGRGVDFFYDGKRLSLPADLAFAAPLLTSRRRFPSGAFSPFLNRKGFCALLADLMGEGAFVWGNSQEVPHG